MWLGVLLLSINVVDGELESVFYPSNTAVISGNNFSFFCGALSNAVALQWKFRKENTYGEVQLYNGTHIAEAFKDFMVTTTTRGFLIHVLAKSTSNDADAGTYTCVEKNMYMYDSVTRISSAQLIVLRNEPLCKANKKNIKAGEYLHMDCIVNYTGDMSPVIRWSRSDGINFDSHGKIIVISSNASVVSKFTTLMTMEDNSVSFMSNISFDPLFPSSDKGGVNKAINSPNYQFVWIHHPNVLYAPKSVNITQKKDVYFVGDILYCVANGNPDPSYEWTEVESTLVISRQSSLTIDSTWMENRVYKCTAANNVSGEETTTISTTVTIHSVRRQTAGFDTVASITITAGVVCGILLLVGLAVAIRRYKDRFWPKNDLHEQQSACSQPDKRDRNSFDTSVTLDQGHEYEPAEMFPVQVQSSNAVKSMESNALSQSLSSEQTSSAEHHNLHVPIRISTCYAKLGDHTSNPPPPIYERLNDIEPTIQKENTDAFIRPTSKATVVQEGIGFKHNPTEVIYANATQVVDVG